MQMLTDLLNTLVEDLVEVFIGDKLSEVECGRNGGEMVEEREDEEEGEKNGNY